MTAIRNRFRLFLVLLVCAGGAGLARGQALEVHPGERLPASAIGYSYVESMQEAMLRDALATVQPSEKSRNGRPGVWVIPSMGASGQPHSGQHYVTNKWGDPRIGISFPNVVDVDGVWVLGQGGDTAWTTGIRVRGYRAGAIVGETESFQQIEAEPNWFLINLAGVDRIEVIAEPVVGGGGWYGLDDLTYSVGGETIIVDFEQADYGMTLTNSGYAGLTWEEGSGDFQQPEGVHGPLEPPGYEREPGAVTPIEPPSLRDIGTPPVLLRSFQNVVRGDAGSFSYPPDTDGAVGPDHYVTTVNSNFAVYDKNTGQRLVNIRLNSFLPDSSGDPRVVFDQHSNRWIVINSGFNSTRRIFLAVSETGDPTGNWFKTDFRTDLGSDAGKWPDYPTLGVDEHGIYTASYMVGGSNRMTIFALDKAPLIAPNPSVGTITAFRELPWEGAIQPAHTYGSPGGEYFVSIYNSRSLRIRRLDPPMTSPTLSTVGFVSVPLFQGPPNAPALGSQVPLNTVGDRLMMSVYRDGSLWTCHTIAASGRAAARWYEIRLNPLGLVQSGTVADSGLNYFFPSIMVNRDGYVAMGFTGSNASQYAGCYFTGRSPTDPAGAMATPVQYKAGTGEWNQVDQYGRNRWGDYSYTTLDPVDETTFYTIQEYGHQDEIWGTYVGVLVTDGTDCNQNGILDSQDIAEARSADCNANGIPDECDVISGASLDCNENFIPDDCEQETRNGLAGVYFNGSSFNNNRLGRIDSQVNFNWYEGPAWLGFRADSFSVRWTGLVKTAPISGDYTFYTLTDDGVRLWVDGQLLIDQWVIQPLTEWSGTISLEADRLYTIRMEYFEFADSARAELRWQPPGLMKDFIPAANLFPNRDCNTNGTPDDCDIAAGTSQDLNGNGVPDECESSFQPGDLNCDGLIDNEDIDPFVLALTNPAQYAQQWPNCDRMLADITGDGLVDNEDIDPFVLLITNP